MKPPARWTRQRTFYSRTAERHQPPSGLTILLITHEMDVVKRICDCVAVISNGELIEQDTVSEVFSHPKTPLAQKFIQSTLHLDIPEDYQERLQAEPFADCVPMLRLEFTGQSVDAPLLSETARRFNVNNNIISAQMDYAGGVKFGIMLLKCTVHNKIRKPPLPGCRNTM